MVPSSSRSRRYGLPSGKTARATRAVSSGMGGTRRSGSDTERPQEGRWRYSVSYYSICPCPLEVNSPAVSTVRESRDSAPPGDVPDLRRPVLAGGGQAAAVRGERCGVDEVGVATE